MAELLHYANEATNEEYIVIDDDSGENWNSDAPDFKLLSRTDIGDIPATLPTNRLLRPEGGENGEIENPCSR